LDVLVRVRTTRQGAGHVLLGHQAGCLLEVTRRGQELRQLTGQLGVRPDPVRGPQALLGGRRVAHLEAALGGRVTVWGYVTARPDLDRSGGRDRARTGRAPARAPGFALVAAERATQLPAGSA